MKGGSQPSLRSWPLDHLVIFLSWRIEASWLSFWFSLVERSSEYTITWIMLNLWAFQLRLWGLGGFKSMIWGVSLDFVLLPVVER